MKSLYHIATGKYKEKYDVNLPVAKYWLTLQPFGDKRIVHRTDGSISTDKTAFVNSRKESKEQLRRANRSQNKSARQYLKKQLRERMNEDVY